MNWYFIQDIGQSVPTPQKQTLYQTNKPVKGALWAQEKSTNTLQLKLKAERG